jgi:16S rRNA (guanine527-N7)-methyltransferase
MADMPASQILLKYFPDLTPDQIQKFVRLQALYEEWNSKINVISRKDMEAFYEHHVLHSLAIAKVIRFVPGTRVLDVGTGGGFPGVPLAIMFPEVHFTLIDSIGKKIRVVQEVALASGLKNVTAVRGRAEEQKEKVDFVVSRAVAPLGELAGWVRKLIRPGTKHILANGILCLKGGDLKQEIRDSGLLVTSYDLSEFFEEEYFQTKKLLFSPV